MTGSDQTDQLRAKTKQFAIGILKLFGTLPKTPETLAIQTPLVKAATTLAANCRALARAWSEDDFHRNRNLATGNADDSVFWLELLSAAGTEQDRITSYNVCYTKLLRFQGRCLMRPHRHSMFFMVAATALIMCSTPAFSDTAETENFDPARMWECTQADGSSIFV